MEIDAIFEDINTHIQTEIAKAQSNLYIVVGLFTNKGIFDELVAKAKSGCAVSLIITHDALNSQLDFEQLNIQKSRVYKIPKTEQIETQFCVIDYHTVFTGIYHWASESEPEEKLGHILITKDDNALSEQLIKHFHNLRKSYFPDEVKEEIFPLTKIIKRLEILKNYIILEDIEELDKAYLKLKEYDFNFDLREIVSHLSKHEFAEAITKIQHFISKNQQLSIWSDPEIEALKLEVKSLENQINAYDNEKTELEKLISDFQHRHTMELGEIILDILKLRKQKFKDDKAKFEEAVNDEQQYKEQLESEKEKDVFELDSEQKTELKKKFRKATTLCHPDKFANEPIEIQKKAEEIFKELNEANTKNDLKRVSEILENLEKGILTTSKGDKLADKTKLRETINRLREKASKLEKEIINIKQSETFKTIIDIEDWDEYFNQTKEHLKEQLRKLEEEI